MISQVFVQTPPIDVEKLRIRVSAALQRVIRNAEKSVAYVIVLSDIVHVPREGEVRIRTFKCYFSYPIFFLTI